MPYDIFGFVETRPRVDGSCWLAAFSVSETIGSPDDFSGDIFGLSKFSHAGAPFANRGLPEDVSPEVQEWLASTARFEMEEGAGSGDLGHTYATLEELKQVNVSPSSAWQALFAMISELQHEFEFPDAEIRVVLWANW
ncbi:hypothetical protein RBA41_03760 [Massilia sp. CCM 9210]|uniref:hypothetical protein n=1 Tax=Massilia scottii TaxID=3057166 RepID=UPI002796496C|nr:hypothetical protein [Massilia sp. CCM 9210]MDQ1812412.1 hypothetical protein [Massilia sp. CCM 9210]